MYKKLVLILGIFILSLVVVNCAAAVDTTSNTSISKTASYGAKSLDKSPPRVVAAYPGRGGTVVPLTATIHLRFNENIKKGVNFSKITVRKSDNSLVPVRKRIYGKNLFIRPYGLKYSTKYSIMVPAGAVRDYKGNKLKTSYKSYFTTEKRPMQLSRVKYWAYQLQNINTPGAVNKLVASRYDMLVLEPTRTDWSSNDKYFNTRAMVKRLKNSYAYDGIHRKLVFAYLDIGEAENWQWYWKWSKNWKKGHRKPKNWPSYILAPDPEGWEGDFPVAYWDSRWKNIMIYGKNLNSRPYGNYHSAMDEILKDGFDGVYLDWVEGYDDPSVKAAARKQKKGPQSEMVKFIKEIRKYGRSRNPNFMIIQQNAADLIVNHREILSQINGISQEAVWYDGAEPVPWNNPKGYDRPTNPGWTSDYLKLLSLYKKAGKPVFNVEYAVKKALDAYIKSRARGFVPYCTRIALSGLALPSYPTSTKAAVSYSISTRAAVSYSTSTKAAVSYSTSTKAAVSYATSTKAAVSYATLKRTSSSSPKYKLVAPTKGVYHSAFPDFGGSEDRVTNARINSFLRITRKKIVWACFSENWGTSKIKFPARAIKLLKNHKIIPYIRLMPRTSLDEGVREKNYTLQRIINGTFDQRLILWARAAKATKTPLMVDFACEMNGDWFPWSGVYNGGRITNHYGNPKLADGPERYRDAYRHIINLFRKEGANNVNWVFHANAYTYPHGLWNQMKNYYPGDRYIDWIGFSAYGALNSKEDWIPFTAIMHETYPKLAKISKNKPLAVLEFGVTEYPRKSYKKAFWIKNALQSIKKGRYPRIKAISYWHENWENEDGTISRLRLDSSLKCKYTYRREISSRYFVTRPLFRRV